MRPVIVVAGTGSNVGKTTLMCRLLQHLEGWEAIKVTRGHFRSCGRDPDTCCVSDLLGDEPKIISDRTLTDIPNKDTGRYWEAGASNVHWLVTTSSQVEAGINRTLDLVTGGGVIIEGTSVLQFINPRPMLAILVSPGSNADGLRLKPTARRALTDGRIDVIYTSDDSLKFRVSGDELARAIERTPIFGPSSFGSLLKNLPLF